MNYVLKSLTPAIALTALVACGGGGDSSDNSNAAATQNVQNDAALTPGLGNAPSLAGATDDNAANDLIINSVTTPEQFTDRQAVSLTFSVTDVSGARVPIDQLSVALEIAGSGSFIDAYRLPLYDITPSARDQFTARSAPVDLPGGSYQARLVVNPSWRYHFATAPSTHSHSSSFRYFAETDYRNNASEVFQAVVSSETACAEDSFENNDNHQSAQPIPVGGQIDASLCADNIDIYSVQLAANEHATIAFNYRSPQATRSRPTSYVVLDTSLTPQSGPSQARDAHKIDITASAEGTYFVAIFGGRSDYRLTRFSGSDNPDLAEDFVNTSLFAPGSGIDGPDSWLFGQVQLQKLEFTEDKLVNQTINCGRITTQYGNGQPLAYVTPGHFADIHRFEFFHGGDYLIDGESQNGWTISDGDIALENWYSNEFEGYAERVSDDRWRYWTGDGLAYVECSIEL